MVGGSESLVVNLWRLYLTPLSLHPSFLAAEVSNFSLSYSLYHDGSALLHVRTGTNQPYAEISNTCQNRSQPTTN